MARICEKESFFYLFIYIPICVASVFVWSGSAGRENFNWHLNWVAELYEQTIGFFGSGVFLFKGGAQYLIFFLA